LFPGNHLAGHLTLTGIIHNVIGGIGVIALVAIPFVLMRKYSRAGDVAFNRFLLLISVTGHNLLYALQYIPSCASGDAFPPVMAWPLAKIFYSQLLYHAGSDSGKAGTGIQVK